MRIGIVTFHRARNYGAVLQAYALQVALSKHGESKVIDYKSNKIEAVYKKLIKTNTIKSFLRSAAYYVPVCLKTRKFRFFRKRMLNCTKPIDTREQLLALNSYFDIFFTGSDQVWHYKHSDFDKAYFLDFVSDNKKKNSYAASFGFERIPQEYEYEYLNLLKHFNNISVRERQGENILKQQLGLFGEVVLDPVFLLNKENWMALAGKKRKVKDKYILIYSFGSKNIQNTAEKIAKEYNLKIVNVSFTFKEIFNKKYKTLLSVGPEEFVNLFMHAEYVVTNSFHGTSFSILFNKQFYTELLGNNSDVNSRLINILELFKLQDRFIKEGEDIDLSRSIDYEKINPILERERIKSLEYIERVLNEQN